MGDTGKYIGDYKVVQGKCWLKYLGLGEQTWSEARSLSRDLNDEKSFVCREL